MMSGCMLLAPILIIALQLEYYIDQDQLGGPKFSQCAVNWRTRVINSGAISRLAMLCTVSPEPRSALRKPGRPALTYVDGS